MSNGEGKGEMIVPIITIASLVLPKMLEMANHYQEMNARADSQGNIVLTAEDKTRMKANLEQLRLPEWDDI